ncbi:MAG: hypothetical protein KDD41_10420 [Flavobacteriales bacterium]|nr:hypothetical protein [Flavobacteriales bacterium]
MRHLLLILLLALLSGFTSCDCVQHVSGVVTDANTHEPVSGVHIVKEFQSLDAAVTDEKGEFSIESISGGLFGCPGMKVIIAKEGYHVKVLTIRAGKHKIIQLKPLNN